MKSNAIKYKYIKPPRHRTRQRLADFRIQLQIVMQNEGALDDQKREIQAKQKDKNRPD